ncbi:reverse transcriptase domain-containing protein [Tanacetum coccineum]
MKKFETPPDSPPIIIIDPDDQPMWSSTRTIAPTPSSAIVQLPISDNFHFLEISNLFQYGENQEEAIMLRTFPFSLTEEAKTWMNELDEGTITSWNELREAFVSRYFSPTKFKRLLNDIHNFHQFTQETLVETWFRMKRILDAKGIFLYNTPNEAFKILEEKVLLKLYFSGESQISPKIVVSVGGNNINSYHATLMDKFEALATKINFEFLIIRKELKEMRDDRRDNHASQIYMKDDMPIKFLPRTTNIKPRHEIVYNIPSNDNNKGDVKFNKEEETEPNPTMPNPNPIEDNSPTLSPFPKDCTMHIPYTDAKTFADIVSLNHVGEKEFKSIVSDGIRVVTTKNIKKNDMGLSKEPAIEWNMGRKIDE